MSDPRKVFLVHGRDWTATQGIISFLRSLGLDPVRWPEAQVATGKPSPSFSEILEKGFEMTAATVVLLTPDEETYLRLPMRKSTDRIDDTGPVGQSRPNVLYELGWAMRHHHGRTVAVRFGMTRIPSDLFGRHMVWFAKETDDMRFRDELLTALTLSGCVVEKRSDWTSAGASELRAAVNQYSTATTSWIEAGTNLRMTRYRYAQVMDTDCQYVLMTGHNFGDQFGTREDPASPLYDNIVRLLLASTDVRIHLVFAPPSLLKVVHPQGYKDLVEKSLPRMWDLTVDPRLADVGPRLRIFSHRGAMFLSAFVRDPEDPVRALLITTPRWVSDAEGPGRLFVAVWRSERPDLFDAVWRSMYSDLRTNEGPNLVEVVEDLKNDLGADYVAFVHRQTPRWRL